MNSGDMLRIFLVAGGLILLWVSIQTLARRKMIESICLAWGFFSILLILAGILLRPMGLSRYVSFAGLIIAVLVGCIAIFVAFVISKIVSDVIRKNQELAMQISILSEEMRKMKEQLEVWESRNEADSLCN